MGEAILTRLHLKERPAENETEKSQPEGGERGRGETRK